MSVEFVYSATAVICGQGLCCMIRVLRKIEHSLNWKYLIRRLKPGGGKWLDAGVKQTKRLGTSNVHRMDGGGGRSWFD